MIEKNPSESPEYPNSEGSQITAAVDVDPRATLTQWRIESFEEQERGVESKSEPAGKWVDEESLEAEKLLNRKGVDLPWSYNEEFGDRDFRVAGLRAGGTGVVYFVESAGQDNKELYAAKTLNSFLKPDYLDLSPPIQEKISQAFLEETLPWLEMGQHPHIVSVHLLKNIVHPQYKRNVPFIFSEFIPGGNLRGYLSRKGRLTIEESLIMGIQICDGLLHAYDHGIGAHKDIKPENVMIYSDGIFQVTDFGANVVGTAGYMAPEQVAVLWRRRGNQITPDLIPVDQRADQFGVGLLILESILGDHPFSICRKALGDKDLAIKYLNEGIGKIVDGSLEGAFRVVLTRTLSTDQADRYPNLSALKAVFREVYESEYGTYKAPEMTEDNSAEWWFHRGEAFITLGRSALAEDPFVQALTRYRRISGTDFERAKCMKQLGMVYRETGRLPEAEKATEEALSLFCRISGAKLDQATCTINLGIIHSYAGHFPEAERAFEEALEILRPIRGTELQLAKCTLDMGTVYNSTGRFPEAERVYREALEIYRSIPGTELEQARCAQNLGITFTMTGRYSEAEKAHKEALDIYRRIPGNEFERGICTMNLGGVYHIGGHYLEAEKLLVEALKIHQSIPGTELEQARCTQNLGSTFYTTGRYAEAEKMFKEALGIYRRISGTDLDQAECIEYQGNIFRDKCLYNKAEKAYQEALTIYRDFPGAELLQGRCTAELARYYQSIDNLSCAREMAAKALKICEPFPPEATEKIRVKCRTLLDELDLI